MSDFIIGLIVVGFAATTWALLALCDWLLGEER
jgi:hypothetical protein